MSLTLALKTFNQPFMFNVMVTGGCEDIQFPKPHSANRKTREFFGTCYHCGCPKHSQNYCILKQCSVCQKFGHADRVCYFNPDKN